MDTTAAYNQLAQALLSICPADFTEAEIVATLDTGWSETKYNCRTRSGFQSGLGAPAELDFRVDEALHNLRNLMQQSGQEPWSACVFKLHPNGTFKFEVSYEDAAAHG